MAERDFLYQRHLVAFRPFVSDEGLPGLSLTFEPDEQMSVRMSRQTLQALLQALQRLDAQLPDQPK